MTEYETKYGRKLDGILACLEKIREKLGITDGDVAKIIGCDILEYEKIKHEKDFPEESKERAIYFIGANMGLYDLFGNNFDAIKNWFLTEEYVLKRKPLELLLEGSRENLMLVNERVLDMRGLR